MAVGVLAPAAPAAIAAGPVGWVLLGIAAVALTGAMVISAINEQMSQSDLVKYIEQAVRQRYGSLDAPDFHFVAEALERTPLRMLAREMQAEGLQVTDDTDPNEDVALSYVIENAHERLFLQMSIVAPFAQLRRVLAGNTTELIASESECRSALEKHVWSALLKYRVRPLDRATLLTPLALALPNTPADEATVYNALFSDDEANL